MAKPVHVVGPGAPKVLVVDDEYAVRTVLTDILGREGEYEVYEAVNGVDAQEILEKTPIDVVVTDLLMPRMGGLRLMQWARDRGLEATWIILTGRGTFQDAVEAIRLGAFDFIVKPLEDTSVLTITFRNALRERQLKAERSRLMHDLAGRNEQLARQVDQLKSACTMLCEQAETLEADFRRAGLIQRTLLPRRAPEIAHLAVNAVYRPSHKVGGDLYDVVRITDRYVGATIADAAGHGVSAAVLAVLLKHRLPVRKGVQGAPIDPREALAAVNKSVVKECSAPGLFITAAYCRLDMETHELVVASAGHPPLMLQRANGDVEMIYHTGPALGLSHDATFTEVHTQLDPGDRLLLYTDGLGEPIAESRGLDDSEIAEMLSRADLRNQGLLHRLMEVAADRRGGAPAPDDITLLLLEADDGPSALDNGVPAAIEPAATAPLVSRADVRIGSADGHTSVSIEGNGDWAFCTAFHDACLEHLDQQHDLTIDLSCCRHLDSTFLGTIHEIADCAGHRGIRLRIQGILPEVRKLFEQIGANRVIECLTEQMQPLPSHMAPLAAPADQQRDRQRVLMAHKALASLNERNREEFLQLVEALQAEADRAIEPPTSPSPPKEPVRPR